MVRKNLGEAAGDALEQFGGEGQQRVIIPACRIKFEGMSWDSLNEVPELKDEMSFTVAGRVVARTTRVMKDGEIRDVAIVDVLSVERITS